MNDLEQKLYTKGLENLYGSVLLGDGRALNHIENMVYLTRKMAASPRSRTQISEEIDFIRTFCAVSWPATYLDIRMEGDVSARQIMRRQLSDPVCRKLLELEHYGRIPEILMVWERAGDICYRLEINGNICACGAISDD